MILHVDMDAFFAAIEQRDDPRLRGRPVIIGGERNARRGVVATASYEARRFGVRSAMTLAEAVRRCPDGIFMPGDRRKYQAAHDQLVSIWRAMSPSVEVVSIDEAFLDVAGCERVFGPAPALAREVQRRIWRQLGLTASIGVAANTLVAKMASDHCKPRGLTVVPPGTEAAFLAAKPVQALWGVGPVTAERLQARGLMLIGDVAGADPGLLRRCLGNQAERLQARANGIGRQVDSAHHERQQVGREETFAYDLADRAQIETYLRLQVTDVAAVLRRRAVGARRVTLKLRDPQFRTRVRSMTWAEPIGDERRLFGAIIALFERHWRGEPLRLVGVTAGELETASRQLTLFPTDD